MSRTIHVDLKPIPWSFTPLPPIAGLEVHEGNTASDWQLWDTARLEAETPDGRAMRLAEWNHFAR